MDLKVFEGIDMCDLFLICLPYAAMHIYMCLLVFILKLFDLKVSAHVVWVSSQSCLGLAPVS